MANRSIEQLKGLISSKDGIARGNVYKVQLPSLTGASASTVDLLCSAVNIPGRQIMTTNKRIGVINQKVAYDQVYDDVNLSFLLLNDYGIRTYFDNWQAQIIDQETSEIGFLNDYAKTVQIQQLRKGFSQPIYSTSLGIPKLPADIQNNLPKIGPFDFAQGQLEIDFASSDKAVYTCELFQAYPTSVGIIELGNQVEGLMEMTVQLSYRNWKGFASEDDAPFGGILKKFGAPGRIASNVIGGSGSIGGISF